MKLIPTSSNPVIITLYRNIPFDNSYKDTALLSRKFKYGSTIVGADNNSFLDMTEDGMNYIFPRTTLVQTTYNFAYGNGLVTSVVLELTGEWINSNYMKVVSGSDTYYYFITGITQKNETTYMLNLELDVFMTYGESFLEAMNGIPVMVERKHCHRVSTSGYPRCSNLVKTDSNFAGVKANIQEDVQKLSLSIKDGNNTKLKHFNWCYVILKADQDNIGQVYKENDILHPYIVLAFPMITTKFYLQGSSNPFATLNPSASMKFWGVNERVYKICILPYPPFNSLGTNTINQETDSELHIIIASGNYTNVSSGTYDVNINDTTKLRISGAGTPHYCVILNGLGGEMNYDTLTLFNYSELNSAPSITNGKDYNELALFLPPFKDYIVRTFADEGYHFSPQRRFNVHYNNLLWKNFTCKTIVSTNPDNTSYFTSMGVEFYDVENKMGLATNYYYSLPTSYTAMQHFLNTASAEYNNAKLINGLNAIASMGMGGMAVSNAKTDVGRLGGASAIVGGVIKQIDNITSYYAKMEDLKNTPSSLTTGGSTFTLDYAMALTKNMEMYPYVSIFTAEHSVIKCASDFFYNYGYEVNRECYFDTDLKEVFLTGQDRTTDVKIFTRTLFNYVKLSEDITTKLVSKIPYTIARKFAEILQDGITIWNFFGFTTLQNKINATGTYDVFKYFHKCTYENAEFYNQSY